MVDVGHWLSPGDHRRLTEILPQGKPRKPGEVYPARPVERGSVPQLPGGDHDVVRSLPVLDLRSPGVGTCQCHFAPLPDLPIDQGQWNPPAGKVRTQTLRRRSSIP